jgi:hypothetical protein
VHAFGQGLSGGRHVFYRVAAVRLFPAYRATGIERLGRGQLERVGAFQLALDPVALHPEYPNVRDAVVQLQRRALGEVDVLGQDLPVVGGVIAPQRCLQVPQRGQQICAVPFDDARAG